MTLSCKYCGNPSIVKVNAKCDDRCNITLNDSEYEGYVPVEVGIGSGDYISFAFCHVCLKILSTNPKTADQILDGFEKN